MQETMADIAEQAMVQLVPHFRKCRTSCCASVAKRAEAAQAASWCECMRFRHLWRPSLYHAHLNTRTVLHSHTSTPEPYCTCTPMHLRLQAAAAEADASAETWAES